MKDKHTLTITVANRVGVLARIAGVLSSRGFNIESIIGWSTENPDVYQIHLVTLGTPGEIEQITKQIHKLIDTIKVADISHQKKHLIYEFILIKVRTGRNRQEILDLAAAFGAKVVDIARTAVRLDFGGPVHQVERFLDLMKPFGIKEFIRSGHIALGP